MLEHINSLIVKVVKFLYSHQHAIYFCSLMLFFFLVLHLCYFAI